jgi:outer membrane lipoprotein LolB
VIALTHRLRAAAPRSTWPHTIVLLFVGALAGCAPSGLERPPAQTAPLVAHETFEAAGRLSARHGAEALAANFQWRHAADHDDIELVTPLGQTIALLTGDGTGVRLQAADGRVLVADNWSALTEQGLGWPLPVEGLKYWMQGSARQGAAFTAEPGEDGRPSVLRQDGWTIVYQTYAEAPAGVWRPSRLTASYPEVELRLAIDRWQ